MGPGVWPISTLQANDNANNIQLVLDFYINMIDKIVPQKYNQSRLDGPESREDTFVFAGSQPLAEGLMHSSGRQEA